MILGIGVDIVDIDRFAQWHTYCKKSLSRIYTDNEITYCLSNKKKTAERFAVRFAAKEAFYKAISSYNPDSFITLARSIEIIKQSNNSICIQFDWTTLDLKEKSPIIHVSLSHSKHQAIAMITISSIN